MKTIKYISVFIVIILSFSCSKNDDDSESSQDDLETLILGSWKIASKTLNGEAIELECTNGLSSIITFSSDTDFSFDVDFNDGNGCVTIPYSATYNIDGNTLTIFVPLGDPSIWTVININEVIFSFAYESAADEVYTETYQKI